MEISLNSLLITVFSKLLITNALLNRWIDFFFFQSFLVDTCPFLGPLVPLFWISGDISSGFQSQSGFCLIRYFCGGECNVHSPRFTSGATLADLLAAGAQLVTSPHICAEVGLGSDSNMQPHEQKTNALPLCQRPGFRWIDFHLYGYSSFNNFIFEITAVHT